MYTTQNLSNTDSVQIVLPTKITFIAIIYSKFFIKHFGELTSPLVDQSATWVAASWFIVENTILHYLV